MKFHVEFTYDPKNREKLIRLLHGGGLAADGGLKINGAWVAVQTGVGYAVIDAAEAKPIYEMCSTWSDFGQVKVTPIILATDV